MITLEYLNQIKHVTNGAQDGDGEGAMLDMLQLLIPALPPMVGEIVREFIENISTPDTHIQIEE